MFLTYLRRELRQRLRQTVLLALGLALGVGLVITVTAVSAGLRDAQDKALRALYGVDTRITVTQPATGTAPRSTGLFSRQLGLLPATSVASIATLPGVTGTAGGLSLREMQVGSTGPSSDPAKSFTPQLLEVTGVGAAPAGPLGSATVTAGRIFTADDAEADVAVVDAGYATRRHLAVGSAVTVGGTPMRVIGVVKQPQGANPANVYVPLARLQRLAGLDGQVNTIYVAVAGDSQLARVRQEIFTLFPAAVVTAANDLSGAVTGSLATMSSLADTLGRWLAIAALAAAFLTASLLTIASVGRRTRELGTLKALGWSSPRIVGQVLGESVVTGVLGSVLGVALGIGGAALVAATAPTLSASVESSASAAGVPARLETAGHAVDITLTAPVSAGTVLLGALLAVAGGLIAGGLGSWRAARLRPVEALARVG